MMFNIRMGLEKCLDEGKIKPWGHLNCIFAVCVAFAQARIKAKCENCKEIWFQVRMEGHFYYVSMKHDLFLGKC